MRLLATLLLSSACLLLAQSDSAFGELQGVVSDPAGASVPSAAVTLKRVAVGLTRQVITGPDGAYRFLLLPPGEYELSIARDSFESVALRDVRVSVGAVATLDVTLKLGVRTDTMAVTGAPALVETGRAQQANTMLTLALATLPIDRRDYLTFVLLAPGVADANSVADNVDLRLKPVLQSGLSFAGSNGRGNSVTVDGGEANDFTGGVRFTLPQEGVQEFQINRSNYSAEFGGSSGGAINIVSKAGVNQWHGSAFDFLRNEKLDAGNPFARVLQGDQLVRTKPPAKRNQFGGSIGGPLKQDRTFVFGAFEGLIRRESSVVSILTDRSIFNPTPAQMQVINGLPPPRAAALTSLLTASPATVALFEKNSGVFPFSTDSIGFSFRLDHHFRESDYFFFRHGLSHIEESNANLQSLVGASRGTQMTNFDPTTAAGWTHLFSPKLVNEVRAQWGYRGFNMNSIDPYGPELRISGFGVFNRDLLLPSRNIERRYEFRENLTWFSGRHILKLGGLGLIRGAHSESEVFIGGRFTFGDLPGTLLDPTLPSTFTINALQSFNLGLAQTYLHGAGDPVVSSSDPTVGIYAQDSFHLTRRLKFDLGLRYEVDVRRPPMPTGHKNVAPRFGFAWSPGANGDTVVRGGYGIYYSPIYYQIDWGVQALNEVDGYRQIAQAFTSIQTAGPASAANMYTTLRNQGVIGIPTPTRAIQPSDVQQFGIRFTHTGPLPPFSSLFVVDRGFRNPYSQQASLGVERQLARDVSVTAGVLWAHTVRLTRTRDINLLPAPFDPRLGIRVWNSSAYFVDPLIARKNIYESTANSIYKAFTFEAHKRFSRRFSLDANYTLSKTLDDITDFNDGFQATDQTNLAAERARSSFDQRHKFVFYGVWETPGAFTISPIIRGNSGHPFNLLVGADLNQDRHDTTDRPAGAGRNTGNGPSFWTVDLRVGRRFLLAERLRLEFTAEAFNLLNRLNFSSVNNFVGNMTGPFDVSGRHDRLPTEPLGFDSAFDPRRLQLGLRLSF